MKEFDLRHNFIMLLAANAQTQRRATARPLECLVSLLILKL